MAKSKDHNELGQFRRRRPLRLPPSRRREIDEAVRKAATERPRGGVRELKSRSSGSPTPKGSAKLKPMGLGKKLLGGIKGMSTGAKIWGGANIASALLSLYFLHGAYKEGGKRGRLAEYLEAQPNLTARDVLRERRTTQLLLKKRAALMREDPEAAAILLQGLAGRQELPALARGEILLGNVPQITGRTMGDLDVLLEAMG